MSGITDVDVNSKFDNCRGYLRAYSFFDEKTQQRKISKDKVTGRKIAEKVNGISRRTIDNKLKELKDEAFIVEDSDFYVLQREQNISFVQLSTDFYKRMLYNFNSDTNNIYAWLLRRYRYKGQQSKPCYFTLGQICTEALGKSDQTANRRKVEDSLLQLTLNGLIAFQIVRVGRTFLRKLTYIGYSFTILDICEDYIEQIAPMSNEFKGDIDSIEDSSEEIVANFGIEQHSTGRIWNLT